MMNNNQTIYNLSNHNLLQNPILNNISSNYASAPFNPNNFINQGISNENKQHILLNNNGFNTINLQNNSLNTGNFPLNNNHNPFMFMNNNLNYRGLIENRDYSTSTINSNFLTNNNSITLPNTDLIPKTFQYKNFPINPKDFQLKISTNINDQNYTKTEKDFIEYYRYRLENVFKGDRKEFLQSILQRSIDIKENSKKKILNSCENPLFLNLDKNEEYNIFNKSFYISNISRKNLNSNENPLYLKVLQKRKLKEELREKEKLGVINQLSNSHKNKQYLSEYYNKIINKIIPNVSDNSILDEKSILRIKCYKEKKILKENDDYSLNKQENPFLHKTTEDNIKIIDKMNQIDSSANITININNIYNNNIVNFPKNPLFNSKIFLIKENDIDEDKKRLEISNYILNNNYLLDLINKQRLTLLKINFTEYNKYEEMKFYYIIICELELELLFKILIFQLKKMDIFNGISEDFFRNYIKNFLFKEELITIKNFNRVFEIEYYQSYYDEKHKNIQYKIYDFIFTIDYEKIKTDFAQNNKKSGVYSIKKIESIESNSHFDGKSENEKEIYCPFFRNNINDLICKPTLKELSAFTKNQLKTIKNFCLENEYGKIRYYDKIDLIDVNLDCIKLDYLDFEILNLDKTSFEKLNRNCQIFLKMNENFEDDEEFFDFLRMLEEKYQNRNVDNK